MFGLSILIQRQCLQGHINHNQSYLSQRIWCQFHFFSRFLIIISTITSESLRWWSAHLVRGGRYRSQQQQMVTQFFIGNKYQFGQSFSFGMKRSHLPLIVLILVLPLVLSQTCSTASISDCGRSGSTCQYFVWNNGTCSPPTSCPNLTVWSNSSFNCIQCGSAAQQICASCATFKFYFNTNRNLCTTCAATYGQLCTTCNSSQCVTCSAGFTLAADKQSCAPPGCDVEYCVSCINPSTCGTCDSIHKLFNGQCVCALANCQVCDGGVCGKCFGGYSLDASKTSCSLICIDNCEVCSNLNSCDSCAIGYYYDSGIKQCRINCTAISPFCVSCTTTTTCSSCRAGYSVSLSGTSCNVQCADTRCTTCAPANINNCTQCSNGFFRTLNATTGNFYCATDICQINFCAKCATASTCETCIDLFTTNPARTQCVPNCNINNCAVCGSATACLACNDGFRVSSNNCAPICSIANCLRCATSATCLRCNDGFSLATDGQSCNFNCNIEGCVTCASSTTCSNCYLSTLSSDKRRCVVSCREGLYLNSTTNSCLNCPTNGCRSCDSLGKCLLCVDLHYLAADFSCVACSTIANCFDCSPNSAVCRTCRSGFDLINNACVDQSSCSVANCRTCSSSAVCSVCQNGYSVSVAGACSRIVCPGTQFVDPDTNICTCGSKSVFVNGACVTCTDNNCLVCSNSACSSCVRGFYPSGTGCVRCGSNCEVCDSTGCTQCRDGFILNSGQCRNPPSTKVTSVANNGDTIICDNGCRVCDLDSATPPNAICRSAIDGYVLVTGKIFKCSSACLTCASTPDANTGLYSICLTCPPGSNFNAGACSRCTDPNALTCRNREPAFSLSCKPGFNAESGTCKACASNCLKCSTAGSNSCDQGGCIGGFFQSRGFPACVKCFNGCNVCDTDPNVCLSCGDYKYLSNNICNSCSDKCITCSSATSCTTCDIGYMVTTEGRCRSLTIDNCVQYNSNFICTKCNHNYVLSSDGLTCTLSLACNATSTCTACKMGYFLKASQCFDCPALPNCLYCNTLNNTLCISCNGGFYSDSGVCRSCGQTGCASCSSDIYCTDAQDGYFLTQDISGVPTGSVLRCGGLCATCIKSDLACLSCQSGASLVGSSCLSDNNFAIGIVAAVTNVAAGASDDYELGMILSVASRVLDELGLKVLNFPSLYQFQANFRMRGIKQSSVVLDLAVNQDSLNKNKVDPNSAVANAKFTDISVLSHSIVTNSESSSSVNLGLVLGVSIPLGVLLVAIIVILKVKIEKVEQESGLDGTQKDIQYQAEQF